MDQKRVRCCQIAFLLGLTGALPLSLPATEAAAAEVLYVTDFLPRGYVRDGSACYQGAIQKAIDRAAAEGKQLVFRPMVYRLDGPAGLKLHSGTTLSLYGAVLRASEKMAADGQVFLGQDVTDVTLLGGEIAGRRRAWPDDVNVAGVRIRGKSARIRIRDLNVHDMSSNAVGVFGTPAREIAHVWIENLLARRCCNKYADYLQPHPGPAKGSRREDQGQVTFYYVQNFVVAGCILEDSRSDGTHFYRSRNGRFVNCQVTGSKMGGYFLESCRAVLAANNLIEANGSRGVTIEAGSRYCTLQNNVVMQSGREGLWAPDSIGVMVVGNIFRHNGRKNDGNRDGEIMINESGWDPSKTPRAENYRVTNNLFEATAEQGATIRVLPKVAGIVIENNTFRGARRKVLVDRTTPDVQHVVVRNNDGLDGQP